MRKFLIAIFIAICGLGAYAYVAQESTSKKDEAPKVLAAETREIPALEALIVQVVEAADTRRILACGSRGCETKEPPSSVDGDARSDGEVWYRYREREDNGNAIRVLEKVDGGGKATTITEESAFVRPRGMMLSADGMKMAYFLDNIHDDSGLTELWVYDSATGGAQVVTENLRRSDVASSVRWNASSRVLWFLNESKVKELVVIPLSGSTALPIPVRIPWSAYADAVDRGVMDVSDARQLIAFTHDTIPGFSQLVVTQNGLQGTKTKKTIKGRVVYIRWMEDGALFYAVQNGENLTFWMANTTKEWPIARMKAQFQSAHSTGSPDLAAFIASPRTNESHLYALQITTGLVQDQMVLPKLAGSTSYVVQANEAARVRDQAVAGITATLSDSVITAFIQAQIQKISSDEAAKAIRIITTDSANTVYVDYEDASEVARRMLVTVQDAIYPSWNVLGTYTISGGQWVRSGVSHNSDPKSVKMYEWEDDVSQWILKKSF